MERAAIFNAGPAVLPVEVLEEAAKQMLNFKGTGQSVMEMSHRSKEYEGIIFGAMDKARQIMGLDDNFVVLFLQGGASMQFLQIPMNFCPDGKVANYINTGTWATKAFEEAGKIGKKAHLAATSKDKSFTYIPRAFTLSDNPAYLHYTTNNTIRGTEYCFTPEVPENVPLICDMSSNFLSRPLPFAKHAMIYAGAQKNIGPAGATMVVIRKDMLESIPAGLPSMMDYRTHVDNQSMYNTPPCYTIYIIDLVLQWIIDKGGLVQVEKNNITKAKVIYDAIDNGDFYRCPVEMEDRSRMNIVFRLPSEELEEKFIKEAKALGMIGLKGHRSVGGCRASTYNALPQKDAEKLAQFMDEFRKKNQ